VTTRPDKPQVRDALDAARRLRASAPDKPLPMAVASYLEAVGMYWRGWLPSEPTKIDRATTAIIRAVLDAYPIVENNVVIEPDSTTK
jgi:hypothetical protein